MAEHFTRQEYLRTSASDRTAHRRYYAQYVNKSTIATVVNLIGGDRLLASTDEHLNDIQLGEWDVVGKCMPISNRFKELGDYRTLGGLVCIAKEAARQWLDAQTEEAPCSSG